MSNKIKQRKLSKWQKTRKIIFKKHPLKKRKAEAKKLAHLKVKKDSLKKFYDKNFSIIWKADIKESKNI